jgi:hypothetical protein
MIVFSNGARHQIHWLTFSHLSFDILVNRRVALPQGKVTKSASVTWLLAVALSDLEYIAWCWIMAWRGVVAASVCHPVFLFCIVRRGTEENHEK